MRKQTIREAYVEIKKIGFENFCKSLGPTDPPCVIWMEITNKSCGYCDNNREKILKELDAKFRKEKLEKLLNG